MAERILYAFEFQPDHAPAVCLEAQDGTWKLEGQADGLRLTHQLSPRQTDEYTFRGSGLAWFKVSRLVLEDEQTTEDGVTTSGPIPQP